MNFTIFSRKAFEKFSTEAFSPNLSSYLRIVSVFFISLGTVVGTNPSLVLEDPLLSGNTAEAHWDIFGPLPAGGLFLPPPANITPDLGWDGFTSAPILNEVGGAGAIITSSQSIYSFQRATSFEIAGEFDGIMENLVLQFGTFTRGTDIDYGSISFRYGANFNSILAPTSGFVLDEGAQVTSYAAQWDFSSLNGITSPFLITFNAAGSSSSLTELRLDASDTFNNIAPVAPIIQNESSYLAYVGSSFELQIEATGEPTFYTQTGLPTGLVLNNNTGLITGIVPSGTASSIDIEVTASGALTSDPFIITLVVVTPTTYSDYMTSKNITGVDAAISADLDSDGMTNIEEYFHGTEPKIADAQSANRTISYEDLPAGPDTFNYSFNWNIQAIDVLAEAQFDDGSFTFTTNEIVGSITFFTDGTAQASFITEETSIGFLRLLLSLAP
ncbi:MAG: putative Ig domain-containing protein [Verrucomicrobiota bacterium]